VTLNTGLIRHNYDRYKEQRTHNSDIHEHKGQLRTGEFLRDVALYSKPCSKMASQQRTCMQQLQRGYMELLSGVSY
jgi:hypothetical protein